MANRLAATISRLQWIVLPALGAFGGAWATGFWLWPVDVTGRLDPALDEYERLVRSEWVAVSLAATASGFFAGLANALAFRTTVALREGRPIFHLIVVTIAMLVGHVLWVEPFWAFHHNHTLGILAWFVLLFEQGSTVTPNLLTAPVTLAIYLAFVFLARLLVRRIVLWPDLPERPATPERTNQ